MSTRYVWDKYDKKALLPSPQTVTSYQFSNNSRDAYASSSFSISLNTVNGRGYYHREGSEVRLNPGSGYIKLSASTYPYITNLGQGTENDIAMLENISGSKWSPDSTGIIYCTNEAGANVSFRLYKGFTYTKGDLVSQLTGATEQAYPSGGNTSDLFYYEYKGSDSIDPSNITYSKSDLQAGETITATVNPVTPTYGGTVYYQYAYSTDGGSSWTNVGSKTTDTSKSITIPNGATQFQVRVQASDDTGFTSATYVLGQNLSVTSMQAYVGINGKARAIEKIYVGVNGKAREVIAGYVGVGGKARKFL